MFATTIGKASLDREPRVSAYAVEAENFESIHNRPAFARLRRLEEIAT